MKYGCHFPDRDVKQYAIVDHDELIAPSQNDLPTSFDIHSLNIAVKSFLIVVISECVWECITRLTATYCIVQYLCTK